MKSNIFKTILIISFLASNINLFSQQCIRFSYDEAGNRYRRQVITFKTAMQDTTTQVAQTDSLKKEETIKQTDNFGKGTVSVYPNPTLGALQVDFTGEMPDGEVLLNVFDLSGKTVVNQKAQSSNNIVNLSAAKPGEYILKITGGGKALEWSIIKQ